MPLIKTPTLSEIRAHTRRIKIGSRRWSRLKLRPIRRWLITPRELPTWTALRPKLIRLLTRTYAGWLVVLVGVILLCLLLLPTLSWYRWEQPGEKGVATYPHATLLNPILTFAAAVAAGGFALVRHFQTIAADRQRRITETFSKAVEHLSNDKIEQRLGGIYTLERLSSEALNSPRGADVDLYWTVMETLTAFVRERARWNEPELPAPEMAAQFDLWQSGSQSDQAPQQRPTPATDIAAVLEVLRRRPAVGREREELRDWHLDLRMTDLRGASLIEAHLDGANLEGAHLAGANLSVAIGDAKTGLPDGVARPADWPPHAPSPEEP